MKKTMVAVLSALLMVGCNAHLVEPIQGSKEITFRVYEQEAMTRAALADACSSLNYYRYVGGELVKSVSQNISDANFGTISDNMEYGTHELFFIGHKSDNVTFNNGIATFDKVGDTFSYYEYVEVDAETSPTKSISMPRRVAKFELVATDALPEYLSTVEVVVIGGSTSLNVSTGNGAGVSTQTKIINVPSSNIGKKGCSFGTYVFLPEGITEVNMTYTFKDENGNGVVEIELEDVPMQTNYITRCSGNVFSEDFVGTISAQSEWAGENDFTF